MVKEPLFRSSITELTFSKGPASQICTSLLADLVQAHAFVFMSFLTVELLTVRSMLIALWGPDPTSMTPTLKYPTFALILLELLRQRRMRW